MYQRTRLLRGRPAARRARLRRIRIWTWYTSITALDYEAAAAKAPSSARAGIEHKLAQTHNIIGVLGGSGARTHLETSAAIAERLGDREAHAAALNNLALALKEAGELERALALTAQALEVTVALGDRHRTAALHNNLADILRALGSKEESMRHLKRAVRIFSEIGGSGSTEPEVWKLVAW